MANLFLYFGFLLSFYVLTDYFLHKIRNLPPSPFPSLPIIGHLYLFKKPIYRTLAKISAKYGPVLLLKFGSRDVLLLSSPSAAEECLSKNDLIFANRPRLIAGKYFGYNFTSLSWSSYGDHWRNLRRISSLEILSTHRVHLLSGIRAEEVRSLVRQIFKASSKEKFDWAVVEMKSAFFELTLNVMMRMIAGKRYYGENVDEEDEVKKFRMIVRESFRIGSATNLGDFVPALRWIDYGGLEKQMKAIQRKRDEFLQNLVDEHRKKMAEEDCSSGGGDDQKKNKTMIEVLLKLQETDPEYYKDEIIRSLMLVLLVSATDTSSGIMEWAMSLLLNNPQVLKKAQIEINDLVGHERLIEESDLAKLPYLHCIINETLRMYPTGALLPHESSDECTVGNYRIPSGTMVLVNLWAIQNDPMIWEDPRKFKPERFEGLEGNRDGFKLMPFGSGRRSCPGEGLGSLPKAQPLKAKCRPRPDMVNLLYSSFLLREQTSSSFRRRSLIRRQFCAAKVLLILQIIRSGREFLFLDKSGQTSTSQPDITFFFWHRFVPPKPRRSRVAHCRWSPSRRRSCPPVTVLSCRRLVSDIVGWFQILSSPALLFSVAVEEEEEDGLTFVPFGP